MLGGGKLVGQVAKKGLMAAITIPEGIIMLIIALFLDFIGLIFFVLSFLGVGIPGSWLLDAAGTVAIGVWCFLRPLYRGMAAKVASRVGKAVSKMPTFKSEKAPSTPTPVKAGGKAVKKGMSMGVGIAFTIITIIVEIIPFLGDIAPTWTVRVIVELAQGEISEL